MTGPAYSKAKVKTPKKTGEQVGSNPTPGVKHKT